MTIAPSTLADGTVVETQYGQMMFTSHGGSRFTSIREGIGDNGKAIHGGGEGWIVRTYSPDPLPSQEVPRSEWAAIRPGSRVRIVDTAGDVHEVTLTDVGKVYSQSEINLWRHNKDFAHVFLLDEPADPDADLVERLTEAMHQCHWNLRDAGVHAIGSRNAAGELARAALAVIREQEATA